MKLSKTLSIGLSHIQNIQEVMAIEGMTFAQATRLLIGLGLGKYFENKKKEPTVITTVVSNDRSTNPEKDDPPLVKNIDWDKVGKQKKEVLKNE